VGEASTGRWAFLKFKQHLIGREFTWITDCSGFKKLFETDYEATHTQQRWKLELLRFDFTIVHRPGRMLTECDLISQYNTWTSAWREGTPTEIPLAATTRSSKDACCIGTYKTWDTGEQKKTPGEELLTVFVNQDSRPIYFSISHPQVTGPTTSDSTELAAAYDHDKTMWSINSGATTIEDVITTLGFNPCVLRQTDEQELWQERQDTPTMRTLLERADRQPPPTPRWTIIQADETWNEAQRTNMDNIITLTKQLGATGTIVAYCNAQKGGTMKRHRELQELAESLDWDIYEGQLKNTHAGGSVEANTQYFVLSNTDIITEWKASAQMDIDPPEPMEAILDVNDGIFEDCNRYQVKTRDELKQQGNSYFAQVKGKINIASYDEADRICKVLRHYTPSSQPGRGRQHYDRSNERNDTSEIKAFAETREAGSDRTSTTATRMDGL
jgi:hypothetical protein